MPRPKTSSAQTCPVARSLDMIGDRWMLLVVRDAFDGLQRFGDFQRSLGVARNILSDRLRQLVEANILQVQPASDGSAYQEYVLTEAGKHLFPIVVALRQWGERHLFARGERHSLLIDKRTRKAVPLMTLRSEKGSALSADQTEVQKVP